MAKAKFGRTAKGRLKKGYTINGGRVVRVVKARKKTRKRRRRR